MQLSGTKNSIHFASQTSIFTTINSHTTSIFAAVNHSQTTAHCDIFAIDPKTWWLPVNEYSLKLLENIEFHYFNYLFQISSTHGAVNSTSQEWLFATGEYTSENFARSINLFWNWNDRITYLIYKILLLVTGNNDNSKASTTISSTTWWWISLPETSYSIRFLVE